MSKITWNDKVDGAGGATGQVTAADMNQIKSSVNALHDWLFESGVLGVLKTDVLPDAILAPDQFELRGDGKIVLIGYENIGGGGLPKPEAPTVDYDSGARELTFTHATYPDDLEYRINGGSWGPYAGTPISVGSGAVPADYYQCRVKAISGETQSGFIAGNSFIASEGGDANLIDLYEYLQLDDLTGTAFPTPPLQPTNNTWKITGDGYGQGQPAKRLAVGGHIAFLYQANSAQTKMCVNYVAGSLGNYKAIEVEVNAEGVVRVVNTRDSIDEDLPTQPSIGQFVNMTRVSGATSPATFSVQIIGSDRTTLVYSKNYTVTGTPVADSAIEYDTAGGAAVINKPQGKSLTNI